MKSGIIYNGPSLLDGTAIIAIATFSNRNSKTGTMLQTYILCRDQHPVEANKTGNDSAICGACNLRGIANPLSPKKLADDRECYVNLAYGPSIVYKAFHNGVYPDATNAEARSLLGENRVVRIGTYGDGAAVPSHIWDEVLLLSNGHTAYSHQKQWRPDIAMQSTDNITEARWHWSRGSRTFRVIADLGDLDPHREVLCPSSKEAGRRTTCNDCKLCNGNASKSPKSIAIVKH